MSLSDADVDALQGDVPQAAHVYWGNGNWTSRLWQDMSKAGCRSTTSPAGFVTLFDADMRPIISGELGRANALIALGRLVFPPNVSHQRHLPAETTPQSTKPCGG